MAGGTGGTGAVGGPWVVQAPTGRSAGDHVCWPFRDRGELAAVARAFLAEGLGRHERVAYVGQGRPRELRRDLAGISGLEDCLDRGQLQVLDIAALPASDPAADPADELNDLAAMTRDSVDAGYTGLRIVANGTMRMLNPRRRERIVHFEHLIDRFCLDHAFTRLCAFDATTLGEELLAELGCVHTLTYGELSPFRLCAARRADAALVGSVDAFSIVQLLEALRRIGVPRPGGRAVLDATDLEFVDVRTLRDLDRHAADAGATLVLRSPPAFVLRLMELLGVRAVRVEQTGPPA
jgi:MEDS: MEthanogen/methylotroph, DcmR Sensory domain/STAS domain